MINNIKDFVKTHAVPFDKRHRLIVAHQGRHAIIMPVDVDADLQRMANDCPWFWQHTGYEDFFVMPDGTYLHRFTGYRYQKLSTHLVKLN